MRSHAIWNKVDSDAYNSEKSYGAKNSSDVEVRVGTSASNSQFLVQHETIRRQHGDWTQFQFAVTDADDNTLLVVDRWYNAKTKQWLAVGERPEGL